MWTALDADLVRMLAGVGTLGLCVRLKLPSRAYRFLSSWSRHG